MKTRSGGSDRGPAKRSNTSKSESDGMMNTAFHAAFMSSMMDIYWAEKALTKALPKLAKKATSAELVSALEEHLAVTQQQVERLEEAFEMLGEKAKGEKCEAMEGLIAEAEDHVKEAEEGMVRDAVIIAVAQKVEHYEIATYGTLRTWARTMGHTDVERILSQILEEEKQADVKLTEIAEASVNEEASVEEKESGTKTATPRSRGTGTRSK